MEEVDQLLADQQRMQCPDWERVQDADPVIKRMKSLMKEYCDVAIGAVLHQIQEGAVETRAAKASLASSEVTLASAHSTPVEPAAPDSLAAPKGHAICNLRLRTLWR